MSKPPPPRLEEFEAAARPVGERLIVGLSKIGLALKSNAWGRASADGVTPTQAQILALLRHRREGMRLSAIAEALGVTTPTASDAVGSLIEKKMATRERDPDDARAARFRLTRRGAQAAARTGDWPDFMLRAVATLDEREQTIMLRAFVKMIRSMQETGDIPVQRMCVTCRHFRPNAHPEDARRPHHCAFVDAPFGDSLLRLDCAEHEIAPSGQQDHQWARWLAGATHTQAT